MKKIYTLLTALALTVAASAQTLNVKVGNVTYQFPAAQAGDMIYTDGTTLTIMDKVFTLTDISSMTVDATEVTDNTVGVVYDSSSAAITVAGNIAKYLTITQSNAHVSIVQSSDVADEIEYELSGTATDGEFYSEGSCKATVTLNGLSLTNAEPVYSGAAICINNGKRIAVKAQSGTTNSLTDAASGSQKGCLYVKGHLELKGKGTLNVVGNKKHAIKSGEYTSVKNCTVNVSGAADGDGINCEQYFLMESGIVTILNVSDDGIQCDIEDTENGPTGVTDNHEDEDTGNIYLQGGTLTVTCDAIAAKGIKAEGDIAITDGTVSVTTTGNGEWDEDDLETKAACGISSDSDITISGGTISLTATGSGGKGLKCDSLLTITGGDLTVVTSGGLYYNDGTTENTNYTGDTDNIDSDLYSSPKGIKAGTKDTSVSPTTYSGGIVISGGTVSVTTSGTNAEGIESKNTMTITDGTVTVNSYDDGLNSAQDMYLQGGTITVVATNNDAIDANGNINISGGKIIACGASGSECGLDAAENYALYITGGEVLALGGGNNAVSSTTGSQCVLSTSGSVSAGSTITVTNGSTTLATFTVPTTYTSGNSQGNSQGNNQGGPGGNQGGPGGNQGGNQGGNSSSNILISCSGLTSGSSYTVATGSGSTSVSASTTSSDSMGGGNQPF